MRCSRYGLARARGPALGLRRRGGWRGRVEKLGMLPGCYMPVRADKRLLSRSNERITRCKAGGWLKQCVVGGYMSGAAECLREVAASSDPSFL